MVTAGFLRDGSSECTRSITDLAAQCSTLPTLSARSYYQGFKVAKVGACLLLIPVV